jgi:hypothetical protein
MPKRITDNKELRPAFIGGHRRCGTTMFTNLFDAHPMVCMFPADSGFFYAYYPVYESDEYTNDQRMDRIIEECYSRLEADVIKVNTENPDTEPLNFDFPGLYTQFRDMCSAGTFTSKEMLENMLYAYRETVDLDSSKHLCWMEKTSSSEIYAHTIFKWFPNARFLHLLRDPRDNYASLKSGWENRYSKRVDNVGFLLQSMINRGKLSMELAESNRRRYGDERYMVVRYEDLTTDPDSTLKSVCAFLGIEFDKMLMNPTVCGKLWKGNNFTGDRYVGPSPASIGRWRERITEEDAQVIEYHFRDIMLRNDYGLEMNEYDCVDAAVNHYKWYNYAQKDKV